MVSFHAEREGRLAGRLGSPALTGVVFDASHEQDDPSGKDQRRRQWGAQ
jgi:hypothetical protein